VSDPVQRQFHANGKTSAHEAGDILLNSLIPSQDTRRLRARHGFIGLTIDERFTRSRRGLWRREEVFFFLKRRSTFKVNEHIAFGFTPGHTTLATIWRYVEEEARPGSLDDRRARCDIAKMIGEAGSRRREY